MPYATAKAAIEGLTRALAVDYGPRGIRLNADLVGASTAVDSLHLVRRGGTVCVSGSLSGWLIPDFQPIAMIPSGTRLTAFHSDDLKGSAGAGVLQRVVREVEAGVYRPNVDRVFTPDDIVAAHRYMEDNQATGKLVAVPQPLGNDQGCGAPEDAARNGASITSPARGRRSSSAPAGEPASGRRRSSVP